MKTLSAIVLVVLAVLSTACNTVQGLGKDIERGGQAIEKAANK
jgi:entericidin B